MKIFPALIGIAAAGAAGFWLEPWIVPSLLGAARGGGSSERSVASGEDDDGDVEDADDDASGAASSASDGTPEPEPEPLPAAPAWVADLTSDQLPDQVVLKRDLALPVEGAANPMTMPAGARVKPLAVEGDQLRVSDLGGSAEGMVAVMATDLVTRFGGKPPAPEPEPEPGPMADNDPDGGGGETAQGEEGMETEEEGGSEEAQEEPEPEPEPEPKTLGDEAIVEVMQKSIKDGEIEEFTFEQVLNWNADGDADHDGETYQSGLVTYKAETIFGEKEIQARALIQDGEVVKWIWPKSGMEIQ